jgi:hypothetical protein
MAKKKCKSIILALIAMTVVFSGVASAQVIFTNVETSTYTVTPYANTDTMQVVKVQFTPGVAGTFLSAIPFGNFFLHKIAINPGATAPTDNYDIYLKDENGIDLLGGAGVDRDTVNSEQVYPIYGSGWYGDVFVPQTTSFSISGNSQAGALGEMFLYIPVKKK